MARIVLATGDEVLRDTVSVVLLEAGYAVVYAASWTRTVEGIAHAATRLLLVDPDLPEVREHAALLATLPATLEHRPHVLALKGNIPGIEAIPTNPVSLRHQVSRVMGRVVSRDDARLLGLLGVGSRPLPVLASIAQRRAAVCITGERGTGKKQVARAVHALGGGGPFFPLPNVSRLHGVVALPWEEGREPGTPGTLYFGLQDEWPLDLVHSVHDRAEAQGWRVVMGARTPPPRPLDGWTVLHLRPLRERPDDLRALVLHYVDTHRKAMGLPPRRFARGMWPIVHGYAWPGNARELESFVVAVLSSTNRALIQPRDVPASVLELADPRRMDEMAGETAAFEDMVERRLRRVVALYEPGGAPTLYEIIRQAVERPLFRLALARMGGSQKAAAVLLGLSRNTLASHLHRLGMKGE